MATRNKVDTIFIKTFGGLTVYQHNVPKVVTWQSNKARLLFCYLICYYHQWVHRDRLLALLWPGGDPVSTEKNFRSTLARLRISLDGFKINPVLRMGDAYRLNFETITCDYVMFRDELLPGSNWWHRVTYRGQWRIW
jgi:two-component SAPR family response regulator